MSVEHLEPNGIEPMSAQRTKLPFNGDPLRSGNGPDLPSSYILDAATQPVEAGIRCGCELGIGLLSHNPGQSCRSIFCVGCSESAECSPSVLVHANQTTQPLDHLRTV